MEYELVPEHEKDLQLVQWKQNVKSREINPLKNKSDLVGLGRCANGSNQIEQLLSWVSEWGLLGFRPIGTTPYPFEKSISFGSSRLYGPGYRVCYGVEPLPLLIKAAEMAKVAVTLFRALRHDSLKERATEIKRLLTQDEGFQLGPTVCIERDGSETITGVREMPTFVGDIYIGMQPESCTPSQYNQVAIGGLAFLTDTFLAGEFRLCWSQNTDGSRKLGLGWTVNSLLAALYLKLGYALRENRCRICGVPITHRKEKATTCGPTCRKRLQRAINRS